VIQQITETKPPRGFSPLVLRLQTEEKTGGLKPAALFVERINYISSNRFATSCLYSSQLCIP